MTSASGSNLFFLQDNKNLVKTTNTDIVDLLDKTSLSDMCELKHSLASEQRYSPTSLRGFHNNSACKPVADIKSTFFEKTTKTCVSDKLESTSALSSKLQSLPISDYITDFISQRHKYDTSDYESYCTRPINEEIVESVAAPCLESDFKFSALLRHPTTDAHWGVSEIRDNVSIKASTNVDDSGLYGWKLDDNCYVFGFHDGDKVYYVKASEPGTSSFPHLILSSDDEHPKEINDVTDDYRCFSFEYDGSSNKRHMRPTHSDLEGHWVGFDESEKLILFKTEMKNATSWLLNE